MAAPDSFEAPPIDFNDLHSTVAEDVYVINYGGAKKDYMPITITLAVAIFLIIALFVCLRAKTKLRPFRPQEEYLQAVTTKKEGSSTPASIA